MPLLLCQIYIGTVTDPYQPLEQKYQLTRGMLDILMHYPVSVSILTKSSLVLRDCDLLLQLQDVDVNFTINTLDEEWKARVEPHSSSIQERLETAKILAKNGIKVNAMLGPFWPVFTDVEALFKKFKEAGMQHVFSESFNTSSGNFTQVEEVLKRFYPNQKQNFKSLLFDRRKFDQFYFKRAKTAPQCGVDEAITTRAKHATWANQKTASLCSSDFYTKASLAIANACEKYQIPSTVYFLRAKYSGREQKKIHERQAHGDSF